MYIQILSHVDIVDWKSPIPSDISDGHDEHDEHDELVHQHPKSRLRTF